VAALVDTNVLVYRFDARFPDKQAAAERLLRAASPTTPSSLRRRHGAKWRKCCRSSMSSIRTRRS
jgi:hypothetical protein